MAQTTAKRRKRPRRRALAAVAVAGALLAPAPASAGWVADAISISQQRWDRFYPREALCGGRAAAPRVSRGPMPDEDWLALSNLARCEIVYDERRYFGSRVRCSIMVHEMGHLYGWRAPEGQEARYGDGSPDVWHHRHWKHPMYPSPVYDYWRCRKAYPR